ncbi:isoflavone reductase family protein-like protein CipA [Glonium stellatum]|uniref:Isoflavone reductase family protein-like protein CipA n=1 Tax=Glonium stellatum TaxID=574774 RepID=A0A8E2JX28_9PEZI|nr:isoflavone reductase family protein-like protein CipA [Glonium stellatum]
MASEIKNVLLIGASGNLGPSVLKEFLDSPFNVSVLSRQESKSTFPSGVNIIKADYSSASSLASALKGQDAVISIVGGIALGDQQKFIDAAIAAGVKRFLPSEFGSNTPDPRVSAIVPVFAAKTGAVDYLKSKESEITWSSLITGPFFDWGIKVGFLGFDLSSKTVTLIDNGTAPFSATTLSQIGKALIAILSHPAETSNKYIYVSSFNTSQREVLEVVEKISGQKWTVKNVNSKELIADATKRFQAGDFSAIPDLIRGVAFGEQGLGDSRPLGLWNERLGLKQEDFEQSIKGALEGK